MCIIVPAPYTFGSFVYFLSNSSQASWWMAFLEFFYTWNLCIFTLVFGHGIQYWGIKGFLMPRCQYQSSETKTIATPHVFVLTFHQYANSISSFLFCSSSCKCNQVGRTTLKRNDFGKQCMHSMPKMVPYSLQTTVIFHFAHFQDYYY